MRARVRRLRLLLILTAFALLALLGANLHSQEFKLVPKPKSVVPIEGEAEFLLEGPITVHYPEQPIFKAHFDAVGQAYSRIKNHTFESAKDASKAKIRFELDSNMDAEAYWLQVKEKQISIKASTIKGLSHATATLLQIVAQRRAMITASIPAVTITDAPDCSYRNFMIDLGRNAHSLECLKETVDLLWFYKVDSFQLHLTDDQRWAFPSKAFPKLLTENGNISWEEFESLEKYARCRGVTLIPELEVPGHSGILRRVYPDVFGKSSTDLAKSPKARKGIKTLLDEMIELFPSSPYIHVGGDEAYGVPEELQRDLINDLHAYLKSKDKKTIVWEGPRLGIGKNKVNEEVIHINWRTINFRADEMLEAGYPVVNAAWDPLYLVDHYPRNNFTMASPEHIYRTLDLYRFKHFNPGIPTFGKPIVVNPKTNPEKPNAQIIGFCMPWWEGREINYFPQVVPRVIPMAEVAWNAKQEKNYEQFEKNSRVAELGRESAFYPVQIEADSLVLESESVAHNKTTVSLKCILLETFGDNAAIKYTLDGSQPSADSATYSEPFELEESSVVRAALFVDTKQMSHGSRRTFVVVNPVNNLALGKPVTTSATSDKLFSTARITDGGTGNLDYYLGYPTEPKPIEITIDLENSEKISRIVVHTFTNGGAFEKYRVEISNDGKTFQQVGDRTKKPEDRTKMSPAEFKFEPTKARYVRVVTNGMKGYVFDSFSKVTEVQVFGEE